MQYSGIQESFLEQSSSASQASSDSPQHSIFNDDLDNSILSLLSKNLPIFIFEEVIQKQEDRDDSAINEDKTAFLSDRILTYNRKAKSLEELSKKFIEHFQGRGNNLIELDKITLQLGVERRRIYDVINILQSLNVVTKKGKNNYEWKGLCEAVRTINNCEREGADYKIQNLKKEKSLEYLASGFLKLFITWKPALSLEQAAKQMMKEVDQASVKTKIRRLYDIINVFRSIGLVKKRNLSSKKPGYQWAGTEYLQHLIMKKQYCDENTGLNELNGEEELQNPQDRSNFFFCMKNSAFSPIICPLLHKNKIDDFKLIDKTKEENVLGATKRDQMWLNQELNMQKSQFPVFKKTKSAFTLVVQGKKIYQ